MSRMWNDASRAGVMNYNILHLSQAETAIPEVRADDYSHRFPADCSDKRDKHLEINTS